jgi:putative endonuclease
MSKKYYVYLMTNKRKTVLYTGITSNLLRRVQQHRSGSGGSFTKRYNVDRLIYYETTNDVQIAIAREKQIKSWSRRRKEDLIGTLNPGWNDLVSEILE